MKVRQHGTGYSNYRGAGSKTMEDVPSPSRRWMVQTQQSMGMRADDGYCCEYWRHGIHWQTMLPTIRDGRMQQ